MLEKCKCLFLIQILYYYNRIFFEIVIVHKYSIIDYIKTNIIIINKHKYYNEI